MKQIKFRVWDKAKKKMMGWQEVKKLFNHNSLFETANYSFMQSVGKKDYEGTEYYEGDLVETIKGTMVVVWNDDKLCWQMENDKACFGGHDVDWTTQIIVGNIYWNPIHHP